MGGNGAGLGTRNSHSDKQFLLISVRTSFGKELSMLDKFIQGIINDNEKEQQVITCPWLMHNSLGIL